MAPQRPGRHDGRCGRSAPWLPAALLLGVGIVALGAASLWPAGAATAWVVVAPPGKRLADMVNIVATADGRLIQPGRFANIVIAGSPRPDFPAALRRAGAWIAIPAPVDSGCLAPPAPDPT
jgi:hypothetical protein